MERTLQNVPQVILNSVYDSIGFNAIEDDILRHLVVARVCQPQSKVATVEYLKAYFDEDVRLHDIYRSSAYFSFLRRLGIETCSA